MSSRTKGYLMLLGGMREIERTLKERMHEDEETIEENGVPLLVESMADQIDFLKQDLEEALRSMANDKMHLEAEQHRAEAAERRDGALRKAVRALADEYKRSATCPTYLIVGLVEALQFPESEGKP